MNGSLGEPIRDDIITDLCHLGMLTTRSVRPLRVLTTRSVRQYVYNFFAAYFPGSPEQPIFVP